MTDRIIVAQANGPQPLAGTPTKTIQINKPLNEQAVVIHLDGATKLDLSAIANESITLVHIGDRLIIIFENHAQVTLEPFYGDNGQPLADLTVELGPGRDVSSSEFASLFPVTTDETVLPASGGPNAPSSGANFSDPTIDPLLLPTPLPFLPPDIFVTQFGTQQGAPIPPNTASVPALSGASINGDTFEGGLATDTINTVGNHPGEPTVVVGGPGTLDGLVNFGPAGPGSVPFEFVSQAAAQAWLVGLHLTSQGMAVDQVTIVGNTLTASTDPTQTGQPTNDPNPHDVFSLTVNPDGSIVFTLLSPLDDANPGHLTPGPAVLDQIDLDLSGFIQAVDAQGHTLTLSNDVFINVHDDAPVLITTISEIPDDGPTFGHDNIPNVVSGTIEESALASPPDDFGVGNGGGTATVTGALNQLVAFGADGPDFDLVNQVYDGFQVVSQTNGAAWLTGLGLTSHGQAVDFASVSGDTLTAWTGAGPTDPTAHAVFSLTINGDGTYSFTLDNPLDHPNPGHDTPGPENADTLALDLSGLVQAVDFDGDAVTLSGDFTINIVDDVPVQLQSATLSGVVDEGALTSGSPGDLFGTGNDPGATAIAIGSVAGLVAFGADGPDVVNGVLSPFQFAIADGSTHNFGVTSHGQEVNFVTVTTNGGDVTSQTLTAWTDGGLANDPNSHEVFTLTLNGDGSYLFTLVNPLDDPTGNGENSVTLDLSAFIQAVDFDGDSIVLSGDFTITVTDDVPVAVSNTSAFATVDEGGLTSGTPGDLFGSGNDSGAATSATESLSGSVQFGADGPAATPFQFVDQGTANGWLTGLGLNSHGQSVDFADINGNVLTAWTGGGPTDPTAHEVFSVTLSGSDYTFQLINPFDDATGNGENSVQVDLSGLIQAVDFDGDAVTLAGGAEVTVTDDVPVAVSNTSAFATVDEGGLTSGTPGDLFGSGNDSGAATSATESLSGSVQFGADGPAATPFQFVDQGTANGWLTGLGLNSHGQSVDFADINGNVLTAWTGGGPTDPTAHEVFSVTLSGSDYTFQLINPFDDATGNGENSVQVDLSGLIQAVDFDGDAVTLAGGAEVTVTDDVPVAVSNTSAFATVDEGGLTSGTPGDLFGSGNDSGAATSATESLSGSVQFGADGPAATPFQFVDQGTANGWLTGLGLNSHGQSVDFADINGNVLTAWTGGGPTDPTAHEVFSVTLSGSDYTFQLINPFDDATGNGENSVQVDLSGLIQAVDFDGDAVTLSGGAEVTVTDDVPVAVSNTSAFATVDEGGLTSGAPGDLFGSGNDSGAAVSATESLSGSVQFGADGPAATPFRFVDQGTANGWLTGLSLVSHGQSVDFADINGNVLTAWTGGGPTDPTAHEVFSVTLSGSDYTFQLINPFDDATGNGENSVQVDLSGLIQAVDFDGDAVTLAGGAEVTVTDDVPVVSGTSSGTVDEGGLNFGFPLFAAGDLYGQGNDPHAATGASGSLASLVSFGADGAQSGTFTATTGTIFHHTTVTETIADGFQLVSQSAANTWLTSLGLSSHDQAVNFATITSATSTDGTTVTDTETLTAWTDGGLSNGGHEVFTLSLNVTTGAWTFQLVNPLDDPAGNGENSVNVDLSGLVQAVDYDGDAATLSSGTPSSASDFNVTVIDDVPVLTKGTVSGIVDEGGLTSATDSYGTGNDPFAPTEASGGFILGIGSLAGVVSFGADGPALSGTIPTIADGFQFAVTSNSTVDFGVKSHGLEVNYVTLSSATVGLDGVSETLTAFAGQGGPAVFTLTLNGDGTWVFHLLEPLDDPTGHGENSVTLDLSGLVQAVDFDGDAVTLSGDFKITVTDDVPVLTRASDSSGSVDEGALTFSSAGPGDLYGEGNDHGVASASTTVSGSIANLVAFGADGPAFDSLGGKEGFQFAVTGGAHDFGVKSHGQEVNFIALSSVTDGADGASQTLTAYTGGSASGTEVFTLTLNGDGTYVFTLINPLDDPSGHGENSVTLNLSGLVQAVDFDGDAVTLSNDFKIIVTDDVPVAVSNTASGTVDEGGLTFSTTVGDLYGNGNDPGSATSATVSLSGSVQFGADGPAATPFQFVSHTTADSWLSGLNLTSHGQAVDFAQIVGNVLTAWTGGGPTDPHAHEVFSVTLSGSNYTFQLINPLDDPNPGHATPGPAVEDGVTLDLSGLIQAVDFDGDAVTLAGGASVTVIDDVPVAQGNLIENGNFALGTFTPAFWGGFAMPGDVPGWTIESSDVGGAQPGFVQLERVFNGYLGVFMPNGDQMVDLEETPGNVKISQTIDGIVSGGTYALEFFAGASNPASAELKVFWDGNLVDDIHPNGTETPYLLDLTGGAGPNVLTFEEVGPSGDNTGTYLADVALEAGTPFGIVDEGGLTSGTPGDLYGSGNDPGAATSATGSLSGLVSFGADGPDFVSGTGGAPFNAGFQFAVTSGAHDFGVMSHGAEVDFITLSSVTYGADGTSQTLTAYAGGSATGTEVFTLTLNGDGTYAFNLINPLDDPSGQGENSLILDLSNLVKAIDYDGDTVALASGSFQIDVIDDVPVAVSNTSAFATVDEGGLTSGTPGDLFGSGNDSGAAVSATVSLSGSVQFGADGPAATPFQFVDQGTANGWLTGLGLNSHGQSVDFADINGNVLTAWTGGGPTDPTAHEVFSVTLSGSNYTFQLINPLDDPNPGHATPGPAVEDGVTLDLSGLIQAVDFDGDAVTLAGGASVTVIDDVPVAQGNLIENGNFALGTFTPAFWGGFAMPGDVPGWTIESSDVGGAQPGFVQLERVFNGYLGVFMPNGDQMVDLEETPGNVKISQTIDGIVSGGTYALEFFAGASNPASAELKVFWDGNLVDDIHPNGTETPYLLDLTGGAGPNVLTFEEVGPSGDNTGTYLADVALEAGTPFGIVDEGGLTSGTPGDLYGSGNDPGAATSATGSLSGLVSFGADGPDFVSGTGGAPFNAGFQFAVTSGAHDFGVMSHGAEVDFITLSSVTYGADGTSQTLTAYAGGSATGTEVFTLTLNGDGTYAFNLINPLDDPSGQGENSLILDLSNLVKAIDYDGDTVALASGSFQIDVIDDVPVAVSNTSAFATVDEGGLTSGTPGDLFGSGNDSGAAVSATVSLSGSVQFGADGPAATPFQFVDQGTANGWLTGLGLNSHGQSVDFADINGNVLTAWTGGGPTDPTAHEVFSVTLSGSDYTFQLINPFDDATGNGENSVQVDLSGLIQAVDFDGDAVTLAGGAEVTVTDDVPVVSGTSSGTVDEGGLNFGFPLFAAGDLYGQGNDPHAATAANGSLASLVSFGADGAQSGTFTATTGTIFHHTTVTETIADGFQLVSQSAANAWLTSLGLSSHDQAVNFATITSATSTDGTTVTDTETLTAWTNGGLFGGGHEVFTLSLNVTTGAWTFQLVNPLDDPAGNGENSVNVDLSGLVQAVDYDGDAATLSSGTPSSASDFNVTVIDDVPVLTKGTVSGIVDEGGLTSATDSYGSGNDPFAPTEASGGFILGIGSLAGDVSFGADGPALSGTIPTIADGFQFAVASNSTVDFGVKSHGLEVNYVTLSSATVGLDGVSETLTAFAGQGGPAVFTLTLNGDGTWVFHLLEPLDDPTGHGENSVTLDLSGLVQAVDFDGDAVTLSGDFKITVTDDVPVLTRASDSSGSVDEGALTFSSAGPGDLYGDGNDHGVASASTTVSGSIANLVAFGADGPAFDSLGGKDGFQFAVSGGTHDFGVKSHGQEVNFIALSSVTDGADGTSQTLTAYTGGSASGTEVFTLTLNGDGTYVFTLINPLDDPSGHGENSVTLNLSGLVQAVDFDGDGVTLSNDFKIIVTDDVPVLTSANIGPGAIEENALLSTNFVNGTDQFGQGNLPGTTTFTSTQKLDSLVQFGADGPNAHPFQFAVADGGAINLGITSHGQAVDFASISGETLTAWTGAGPTDSTAHEVFSLSINADDTFTFDLLNPIDFAGTHAAIPLNETTILNLGALIEAVDFDGDAAPLSSGAIAINIGEDGPLQIEAPLVSGTVDEGALAYSAVIGDLFGNGNDQGSASFTTSGTLAGMVAFGADGPAFDNTNTNVDGFQFVGQQNGEAVAEASAVLWLMGLGLTSHGVSIDSAKITFGDGAATLIASTDPNSPDPHEVFQLVLNGDGTWTFTLFNPVDHPTGNGENSLSIDLTGLVQAVDYDGDTVALQEPLNGNTHTPLFTVNVTDDIPIAQGNLVENGDFTSGTFTPMSYGGATTVTDGSGGLDWLLASSAVATDGNAAQPGFVELERINPGYLGTFMPNGSPMVDMDASPGDVQISQAVHGITAGESYELAFWTAASVNIVPPNSTELEVFWGGQLVDTVTPLSETPTLNLITLVGGAGDGTNTLTFAEAGVADNYGTYLGGVSLEAGTPFGIVDEGGLTTPFQGNDPFAPTFTQGSIAGLVSFGADGPAAFAGSPDLINGFQFVSNAEAVLAGMHLSSESSAVDHVTFVTNPAGPDGAVQTTSTTLEAFAHDGHEVFALTLEGDGSWNFQLTAPLDNPAPPQGAGEDSTIIDFSKLVDALDFDGDTTALASGSFTVAVIDDVPSASNVAATMAANAPETVTVTEPANFSFGADGPGAVTFDIADASFLSDPTGGHLTLPTAGQYTINGDSITLDPGTDFQALVPGETATLEIPYTVTDHDGDTATADIDLTINGADTVTTHSVSILADQTNFAPVNHAGPESTSNDFSIPVLALLQGDSSSLVSDPLNLTVTGVSSSVPGVSLTSDHDYILFPFLSDGTSGTFSITVSDGTTTALETVAVNQVQTLPSIGHFDEGGLNGNNFLIENQQSPSGFSTLANVSGDDVLISNRPTSQVDGYDSIPGDGHTPLDSGENDFLFGVPGNTLTAGAGNDTLWGEGGHSTLNGGQVADKATTFYFQSPNDAASIINNFDSQPGQNDVISLSAVGFNAAAGSTVFAVGQAVTVDTTTGSNPNWTSGDHLMYDTTNSGLYYSDNGTGAASHLVLLATVTNHTVTGSDVHVVA